MNCLEPIASTGLCETCGRADTAGHYRGMGRAERIVRDAAGALLQTTKYATTKASDALFAAADRICEEGRASAPGPSAPSSGDVKERDPDDWVVRMGAVRKASLLVAAERVRKLWTSRGGRCPCKFADGLEQVIAAVLDGEGEEERSPSLTAPQVIGMSEKEWANHPENEDPHHGKDGQITTCAEAESRIEELRRVVLYQARKILELSPVYTVSLPCNGTVVHDPHVLCPRCDER